ncbi:hypothetical protein SEMRO_2186_G318150.1 [Seminavis robusta]|uniref:Uncharacterized protein n=1 Tax=Seminavis robusta TaxID=568900 RepID=A0A9N8HWI2_9STRA|nr:hypothetical protein SEMRO_2186_G318150.1 [Seminavis robusta]|eukprot:Sro2186_g318150.1 n/a (113) ;mRNA; f:10842-11180
MEDRPQKPSRKDLTKVVDDFKALYTAETPCPPGDPVPVLATPANIRDDIPDEEEIKAATLKLRNHRAAGPSKLTADTFKEWIKRAFPEEFHRSSRNSDDKPPQPNRDLGQIS